MLFLTIFTMFFVIVSNEICETFGLSLAYRKFLKIGVGCPFTKVLLCHGKMLGSTLQFEFGGLLLA